MPALHVIKIGGHVIDDEATLGNFLAAFARMTGPRILVHGGGKIASRTADKLKIPVTMVDGRRVTDQAMLEVVVQVYGGWVNKNIVARLQSMDCHALGMTGADANLILARKRPVREVDYGFVGDIEKVNANALHGLLQQGMVPVCAPLTHDGQGQLLNTNADTIASALAVAMSDRYAVELIYGFEKKGVLKNIKDEMSLIPEITKASYETYKKTGIIADGMIPKIDNAFAAIGKGVKQVVICQAGDIGQQHAGTRIVS